MSSQPKQFGTLIGLLFAGILLLSVYSLLNYSLILYMLATNTSVPTITNVLARLGTPVWALYFFLFLQIGYIVSVVTISRWKKWGFYLFCVLALAGFVVNLEIGITIYAFTGLIIIGVLYLLLRSKWNLMT